MSFTVVQRLMVACIATLGASVVGDPPPTVEDLKRVLEAKLMSLTPKRFTTRTVLFEQVTAAALSDGTPRDGVYSFVATVNVHDYSPGAPARKEYGETCLRRMESWTFGLKAATTGGWVVEGRVTGADSVCMSNPSAGESAIPLESLMSTASTPLEEDAGNLPTGEWACHDANDQPVPRLSFVLRASGRYSDVDGARGGTFVYSGTRSEITFRGGFLGGQTGTNVQSSGFALSATVTCEPKK